MKIGLLSDTHSYLDPALKVLFSDCDEVWHAGDIGNMDIIDELESWGKPLKLVFGNIDGGALRQAAPLDQIFNVDDCKVWIRHIGGYPNRYPKKIKALLSEIKPDLFICGHSHILRVIYDKKNQLLHMNPGACGNVGFHSVRTALKFDIIKSEIKNAQIIELGGRSLR